MWHHPAHSADDVSCPWSSQSDTPLVCCGTSSLVGTSDHPFCSSSVRKVVTYDKDNVLFYQNSHHSVKLTGLGQKVTLQILVSEWQQILTASTSWHNLVFVWMAWILESRCLTYLKSNITQYINTSIQHILPIEFLIHKCGVYILNATNRAYWDQYLSSGCPSSLPWAP